MAITGYGIRETKRKRVEIVGAQYCCLFFGDNN